VHDHAASRKDVTLNGTTYDDRFGLNLSFDLRSWIYYKRIVGEDLAAEVAADANGALKGQSTIKRRPFFQERRN
jgi:hypothetical protein